MALGSRIALAINFQKKISNLCDLISVHQRLTDRQMDGQKDDMRWQDRALHYSASDGKKITFWRREFIAEL